ncbi:unnamed protein product [Brassicogethes aeneus]|uniref:Regulatory protein zeste n=1 Tax=Brassicogethes aeneus TaxID=1431903 RepID=A0A9P0B716_BRAAE|nr:unnamed protein product [Brassicogethes aeneus]
MINRLEQTVSDKDLIIKLINNDLYKNASGNQKSGVAVVTKISGKQPKQNETPKIAPKQIEKPKIVPTTPTNEKPSEKPKISGITGNEERIQSKIAYIEENRDMVYPSNEAAQYQAFKQKWEDLAKHLNAIDGPQKTTKQWKSVFNDLKSNAKKKQRKLIVEHTGTGGGPSSGIKLSELDERIIQLINPVVIEGVSGIDEGGIIIEEIFLEPVENIKLHETVQKLVLQTIPEKLPDEKPTIIHGLTTSTEDVRLVNIFYLSDDVSRQAPGKRDTKSVKNPIIVKYMFDLDDILVKYKQWKDNEVQVTEASLFSVIKTLESQFKVLKTHCFVKRVQERYFDEQKVHLAEDKVLVVQIDFAENYSIGKSFPFEFDVRVPFLVRGPGVEPGTVVDDIVLNIDLAPTFLDMAGVEAPPHMDGRSVLPLFLNYKRKKTVRKWSDTFLIESSGRRETPHLDAKLRAIKYSSALNSKNVTTEPPIATNINLTADVTTGSSSSNSKLPLTTEKITVDPLPRLYESGKLNKKRNKIQSSKKRRRLKPYPI